MDLEIFILNIEKEGLLEEIETLLREKYLSPEDLSRIRSINNKNVRTQKLLSISLIQYVIKDYLCLSQKEIKIKRDPYNRPFLISPSWKGDFNLSNTDSAICLVISNSGRVGVDIEQICSIDPADFHSYFSSSEKFYVNSTISNLKKFYTLWTLKESYIKALGYGVYYNFKEFEIIIGEDSIQLNDFMNPYRNSQWKFKTFEDHNHQISVCTNFSISKINFHYLNVRNLLVK